MNNMAQYHFPPVDLLSEAKDTSRFSDRIYVSELAKQLNKVLYDFKIDATVLESNAFGFCILFRVKLGEGVPAETIRKMRT